MTTRFESPVAFVGLMGAGKSAVARRLAVRLGVPVADLDARLEAGCGLPVADIFTRLGESAFREREAFAFAAALAEGVAVIDGGGGLVLDPENRRLLRTRCRTVWLEVSPAVAADRVAAEAGQRPLLAAGDAEARLERMLHERRPLYEEVAWCRVTTVGRSPDEVVEAVIDLVMAGA